MIQQTKKLIIIGFLILILFFSISIFICGVNKYKCSITSSTTWNLSEIYFHTPYSNIILIIIIFFIIISIIYLYFSLKGDKK